MQIDLVTKEDFQKLEAKIDNLENLIKQLKETKQETELLSMREASKYLQVAYSRLSIMASNGIVKSIQRARNGTRLFRKSDLEEYLNQISKNPVSR